MNENTNKTTNVLRTKPLPPETLPPRLASTSNAPVCNESFALSMGASDFPMHYQQTSILPQNSSQGHSTAPSSNNEHTMSPNISLSAANLNNHGTHFNVQRSDSTRLPQNNSQEPETFQDPLKNLSAERLESIKNILSSLLQTSSGLPFNALACTSSPGGAAASHSDVPPALPPNEASTSARDVYSHSTQADGALMARRPATGGPATTTSCSPPASMLPTTAQLLLRLQQTLSSQAVTAPAGSSPSTFHEPSQVATAQVSGAGAPRTTTTPAVTHATAAQSQQQQQLLWLLQSQLQAQHQRHQHQRQQQQREHQHQQQQQRLQLQHQQDHKRQQQQQTQSAGSLACSSIPASTPTKQPLGPTSAFASTPLAHPPALRYTSDTTPAARSSSVLPTGAAATTSALAQLGRTLESSPRELSRSLGAGGAGAFSEAIGLAGNALSPLLAAVTALATSQVTMTSVMRSATSTSAGGTAYARRAVTDTFYDAYAQLVRNTLNPANFPGLFSHSNIPTLVSASPMSSVPATSPSPQASHALVKHIIQLNHPPPHAQGAPQSHQNHPVQLPHSVTNPAANTLSVTQTQPHHVPNSLHAHNSYHATPYAIHSQHGAHNAQNSAVGINLGNSGLTLGNGGGDSEGISLSVHSAGVSRGSSAAVAMYGAGGAYVGEYAGGVTAVDGPASWPQAGGALVLSQVPAHTQTDLGAHARAHTHAHTQASSGARARAATTPKATDQLTPTLASTPASAPAAVSGEEADGAATFHQRSRRATAGKRNSARYGSDDPVEAMLTVPHVASGRGRRVMRREVKDVSPRSAPFAAGDGAVASSAAGNALMHSHASAHAAFTGMGVGVDASATALSHASSPHLASVPAVTAPGPYTSTPNSLLFDADFVKRLLPALSPQEVFRVAARVIAAAEKVANAASNAASVTVGLAAAVDAEVSMSATTGAAAVHVPVDPGYNSDYDGECDSDVAEAIPVDATCGPSVSCGADDACVGIPPVSTPQDCLKLDSCPAPATHAAQDSACAAPGGDVKMERNSPLSVLTAATADCPGTGAGAGSDHDAVKVEHASVCANDSFVGGSHDNSDDQDSHSGGGDVGDESLSARLSYGLLPLPTIDISVNANAPAGTHNRTATGTTSAAAAATVNLLSMHDNRSDARSVQRSVSRARADAATECPAHPLTHPPTHPLTHPHVQAPVSIIDTVAQAAVSTAAEEGSSTSSLEGFEEASRIFFVKEKWEIWEEGPVPDSWCAAPLFSSSIDRTACPNAVRSSSLLDYSRALNGARDHSINTTNATNSRAASAASSVASSAAPIPRCLLCRSPISACGDSELDNIPKSESPGASPSLGPLTSPPAASLPRNRGAVAHPPSTDNVTTPSAIICETCRPAEAGVAGVVEHVDLRVVLEHYRALPDTELRLKRTDEDDGKENGSRRSWTLLETIVLFDAMLLTRIDRGFSWPLVAEAYHWLVAGHGYALIAKGAFVDAFTRAPFRALMPDLHIDGKIVRDWSIPDDPIQEPVPHSTQHAQTRNHADTAPASTVPPAPRRTPVTNTSFDPFLHIPSSLVAYVRRHCPVDIPVIPPHFTAAQAQHYLHPSVPSIPFTSPFSSPFLSLPSPAEAEAMLALIAAHPDAVNPLKPFLRDMSHFALQRLLSRAADAVATGKVDQSVPPHPHCSAASSSSSSSSSFSAPSRRAVSSLPSHLPVIFATRAAEPIKLERRFQNLSTIARRMRNATVEAVRHHNDWSTLATAAYPHIPGELEHILRKCARAIAAEREEVSSLQRTVLSVFVAAVEHRRAALRSSNDHASTETPDQAGSHPAASDGTSLSGLTACGGATSTRRLEGTRSAEAAAAPAGQADVDANVFSAPYNSSPLPLHHSPSSSSSFPSHATTSLQNHSFVVRVVDRIIRKASASHPQLQRHAPPVARPLLEDVDARTEATTGAVDGDDGARVCATGTPRTCERRDGLLPFPSAPTSPPSSPVLSQTPFGLLPNHNAVSSSSSSSSSSTSAPPPAPTATPSTSPWATPWLSPWLSMAALSTQPVRHMPLACFFALIIDRIHRAGGFVHGVAGFITKKGFLRGFKGAKDIPAPNGSAASFRCSYYLMPEPKIKKERQDAVPTVPRRSRGGRVDIPSIEEQEPDVNAARTNVAAKAAVGTGGSRAKSKNPRTDMTAGNAHDAEESGCPVGVDASSLSYRRSSRKKPNLGGASDSQSAYVSLTAYTTTSTTHTPQSLLPSTPAPAFSAVTTAPTRNFPCLHSDSESYQPMRIPTRLRGGLPLHVSKRGQRDTQFHPILGVSGALWDDVVNFTSYRNERAPGSHLPIAILPSFVRVREKAPGYSVLVDGFPVNEAYVCPKYSWHTCVDATQTADPARQANQSAASGASPSAPSQGGNPSLSMSEAILTYQVFTARQTLRAMRTLQLAGM